MESFLSELDLQPYPMFYQHVTQELFELIIGKKLEDQENGQYEKHSNPINSGRKCCQIHRRIHYQDVEKGFT